MTGTHKTYALRRIRLDGLVAAKEAFLRDIESVAREGLERTEPLFRWRKVEAIRRRLEQASRQVADECAAEGFEPADLAPPSRRAYQLISYLTSPEHLETHLATLQRLDGRDGRQDAFRARLDHTSGVYRIEHGPSGTRLLASEGFVGAPDTVLQALVRLATPYARKRGPRQVVREYADGPRYASALRRVEGSGGAYRSRPSGRVYDLRDLFESVNRSCFEGRLAAPRLLWSERVPRVECGHYEPATDTVRLSRRLDSPAVPRFVLEHVMHHELLHRVLGSEVKGSRRLYHSARFRREERRFPHYREAELFLRRWARTRGERRRR
jgi:hypothetical protein